MTLKADLSGQVALVTGASSGLGRHFAKVLSAAGANVALVARRAERLQALAEEIEAEGGVATAVPADITSAAGVAEAFARAAETLGPVTVVVNNAGVARQAPALDVDERMWNEVVDTNLRGAWLVAREAGERMKESGGGSIINIASILALRVIGHNAPYIASKAGLMRLTQALALEWARYDIRVNAIAPGYFETDINREFFASPPGQALIKRIPQRRLGRVEDLDGVLLLLASDASRYMNGTVIPVDGGHLQSSL